MSESEPTPDPTKPLLEGVDLPTRLAFLELSDADAQRLRAMLPDLESTSTRFIDSFYDHLLSFESTARFFRDEQLVRRLKQYQREHLRMLLGASWDEEYVEHRARVGATHAARGVEPHLFLAAFYQFVQFELKRLHPPAEGAAHDERLETVLSLIKTVFLDVGLTLDAYFRQLTRDLEQALDMLWKSNTELRQFAQLASHDLKTPLATVSNLCEELLDEYEEQLPGDSPHLVRSAQRTALRMSKMIDELLSSSATVHAAADDAAAPVSGDEVIREVLERVQPLLQRNKVEVIVHEPLPEVVGQKPPLREVFYNLVSNAAKYIEEPPRRIEISAHREGEFAVFVVADNGPGIPAEDLQQVFAPFRRLARHERIDGSGLGLYFAKSLIEKLGGRIWVESTEGAGCRFCVALRR